MRNCPSCPRLRISSLAITSQGFKALLASLPSIRHLTLDRVDVDSASFRSLPNEELLPHLEVLKLLHSAGDFYPQDLCAYLSWRKEQAKGGDTLRQVVLELESGLGRPDETTYYARELRDGGLDINIFIGEHRSSDQRERLWAILCAFTGPDSEGL